MQGQGVVHPPDALIKCCSLWLADPKELDANASWVMMPADELSEESSSSTEEEVVGSDWMGYDGMEWGNCRLDGKWLLSLIHGSVRKSAGAARVPLPARNPLIWPGATQMGRGCTLPSSYHPPPPPWQPKMKCVLPGWKIEGECLGL